MILATKNGNAIEFPDWTKRDTLMEHFAGVKYKQLITFAMKKLDNEEHEEYLLGTRLAQALYNIVHYKV